MSLLVLSRVLALVLSLLLVGRARPQAAGGLSLAMGRHHWMKAGRHGTFLYNMRDTYIGQSLHHYGEWSEYEVQVFAQVARPGDWVLDVGANIGGFTVPFINMVHAREGAGEVWAFEPQRVLHGLLTTNVALNEGGLRVRTFNMALGARRGTVQVPRVNYSVEGNFGGVSLLQRYAVTDAVPLETLDNVVEGEAGNGTAARCPSFVKIDVEGMEVVVIRGGERTLRRCRPVLYVENNCRKDSPAIIQALDALGYELYWDLQPYFNPHNFFNNSVDIFVNAFMSYNVLAVPADSKFTLGGFTRIRNEASGWFVDQYDIGAILPHYHTDRTIEQNGDMESCTR